jgi:hypothetical protein
MAFFHRLAPVVRLFLGLWVIWFASLGGQRDGKKAQWSQTSVFLFGRTDMVKASLSHGTPDVEDKLDETPTTWVRVSKVRRPRRLRQAPKPPLTIDQILAWADHEFRETGRWPKTTDGHVVANRNEKWCNINAALMNGGRSLPGGTTLAQVLATCRGVRNLQDLPSFSEEKILAWADHEFRERRKWPRCTDGVVAADHSETWHNVDAALRMGFRGLPGGSSLPSLLAEKRGVPNIGDLPRMYEDQIVGLAKAFFERHSRWPTVNDGVVEGYADETWYSVNKALYQGLRGLPGKDSLARLLARHFGVRNRKDLPRLTIKQILVWADAHRARSGKWPVVAAGPILHAPGETWLGVDAALREGIRGLKGGTSLTRVLTKNRGARNKAEAPPLSLALVLAWADAHHRRTGQWPTQYSGAVADARGETWSAIQTALQKGGRGFPGEFSIRKLLVRVGRIPKRLQSDKYL